MAHGHGWLGQLQAGWDYIRLWLVGIFGDVVEEYSPSEPRLFGEIVLWERHLPQSPAGPAEWRPPAATRQCSDPPPCISAALPRKRWAPLCMDCWYEKSNPISNEVLELLALLSAKHFSNICICIVHISELVNNLICKCWPHDYKSLSLVRSARHL